VSGRERLLAWLIAVLILLVAMSVSPLLLARPTAVRWIAIATHTWSPSAGGADRESVLRRAETVRQAIDPLRPAGRYPARWSKTARDIWTRLHAAGFGDDELSHLRDVRGVFGLALWLTAASAALAAVLAAFGGVKDRRHLAFGAATRALILGGTAAAVLLATGALAFEPLFGAFHALFFREGTWTFPMDSWLIRTFPERFWAIAAAGWAGMTIGWLGLAWLGAFLVDRRRLR